MNAVALITQNPIDQKHSTWQYDKIMAAIAFDIDVTVVFIEDGVNHILDNKVWKSLDLYGVEHVFYVSNQLLDPTKQLFNAKKISHEQLSDMIAQTEMML